jgi:hypothetical protein
MPSDSLMSAHTCVSSPTCAAVCCAALRQVSPVRYGKVTAFDAATTQVTLEPWPDPGVHPAADQLLVWKRQQQQQQEAAEEGAGGGVEGERLHAPADYGESPWAAWYSESGRLVAETNGFVEVRVVLEPQQPSRKPAAPALAPTAQHTPGPAGAPPSAAHTPGGTPSGRGRTGQAPHPLLEEDEEAAAARREAGERQAKQMTWCTCGRPCQGVVCESTHMMTARY